jgi:hypothetical protein
LIGHGEGIGASSSPSSLSAPIHRSAWKGHSQKFVPRKQLQATRDHDMKVRVLITIESTGLDGPGPHPEPNITPEPEWVDKPA